MLKVNFDIFCQSPDFGDCRAVNLGSQFGFPNLSNGAQRRRLAAGLVFEKRPARLQSRVLKIELKIILN